MTSQSVDENVAASTIAESDAKCIEDAKELCERHQLKEDLLKANQAAKNNQLDESALSNLDASLKRNNGFIRKLRTVNDSQKAHIMEECQQLNLSKYLAEVSNALVDAKLRLADVPFVLRLCSQLHQRYADFGAQLLEKWKKSLPTTNSKDFKLSGGASKYRFDLRLFADLNVIGIFPQPDGIRALGAQLHWVTTLAASSVNTAPAPDAAPESTSADDTLAQVATLITAFCKYCGDDWTGLISQNLGQTAEKQQISLPSPNLVSPERQQKVRQLLQDFYTDTLCARAITLYQEVRRQEKANLRLLENHGEVSQTRQKSLQSVATAYNKLYTCACSLADFLHTPLPQLPKDEDETDEKATGIIDVERLRPEQLVEYEGEKSLFDDEETRQFYESLSNLKAMLPAIICSKSQSEREKESPGSDKKTGESGETGVETSLETGVSAGSGEGGSDTLTEIDDVEMVERELEREEQEQLQREEQEMATTGSTATASVDGDDGANTEGGAIAGETPLEEEGADKTPLSMKTAFDGFLSSLTNCVNRDMIDKAAMEFCLTFNTRANRRKLARSIVGVHRNRIDLIPFYGRLVATLKPLMPDLVEEVNGLLLREVRYHIAKKEQMHVESKLKTVRLIGEMVKFQVMPSEEALRVLKSLLAHFTHHQIDMTCALLETCGRFLYRSPKSHPLTRVLLKVLMRKKALLLDSRHVVMIDNAYYYSNPPSNTATKTQQEELLPAPNEYMRHLLLSLHRGNMDRHLSTLEKFDWDDPIVYEFALQSFSSPWLLRFNCLRQSAHVLSRLGLHHDSHKRLQCEVVDNLLEDVRRCMEINLPKLNQRRLTVLKFIGYMFEYMLVEADVIFDLLYLILTYGSTQLNEMSSPLDPPEHLFRVTMICTLLESTAHYFTTGSTRKKLGVFLKYFQRYFWFKRSHPIFITTEANSATKVAAPVAEEGAVAVQSQGLYYFPMQVEQHFYDTLEGLELGVRPMKSFAEAQRAVASMESQYRGRLRKSKVGKELFKSGSKAATGMGGSWARDALGAIAEGDAPLSKLSGSSDTSGVVNEEPEGSDSDKEEPSQQPAHRMANEEDDEDGESGEEDGEGGTARPSSYAEEDARENEAEDGGAGKAQERSTRLRFIDCVEDEEFRAMLDHMATDTVQSRSLPQQSAAANFSGGQLSIPLAIRSIQKKLEEQKKVPDWLPQDAIPFTLLTRPTSTSSSGAAAATASSAPVAQGGANLGAQAVFIPKGSSFVNHFMHIKAQEEAEHAQMKQQVLQMHKTQLQEDEENLEQSVRERFPNMKVTRTERGFNPHHHCRGGQRGAQSQR